MGEGELSTRLSLGRGLAGEQGAGRMGSATWRATGSGQHPEFYSETQEKQETFPLCSRASCCVPVPQRGQTLSLSQEHNTAVRETEAIKYLKR